VVTLQDRLNRDPAWQDIAVIFSDAKVHSNTIVTPF
jgi:5'-3' exonuclease